MELVRSEQEMAKLNRIDKDKASRACQLTLFKCSEFILGYQWLISFPPVMHCVVGIAAGVEAGAVTETTSTRTLMRRFTVPLPPQCITPLTRSLDDAMV